MKKDPIPRTAADFHVGVQYYRPPFPEQRFWEDDFRKIRDSGFNTVQLWVLWSWVEAKPGRFEFGDYDRLVELAAKNGLDVVLSVIPELQPHWIHRIIPDSELVDCHGHKVMSGNRNECHFGVTPGGCFDNPEVWRRMSAFIERVVKQYRDLPHLHGWDIWNELRWNVQASELVCYCQHTLETFRDWLKAEHGDLDGLNRAWCRRYSNWDDVLPGIATGRPFTELMAYARFITWRCAEHARMRYDIFRRLDGTRPATVHGDSPSFLKGGGGSASPLDRGNDWDYADHLDGIGCSSFPLWGLTDAADFSARIESLPSSARGKKIWLSEVQGGQASGAFQYLPAVPARHQQRWLWTGFANRADTVLFWCWRDEVFTIESGGFGFYGNDGFFSERSSAMRSTSEILKKHSAEFAKFQPDIAKVAVLFSPESYNLYWASEGKAAKAQMALQGYGRALLKKHIPFRLVEERHLDSLDGIKLLFLPRMAVASDKLAGKLEAFVRNGGIMVCDPGTGAFDERGIFRYPEERFTAKITGNVEIGRRKLEGSSVKLEVHGRQYQIPAAQWLEPIGCKAGEKNGKMVSISNVGKGHVIQIAAYAADPYIQSDLCGAPEWEKYCGDFENLVADLAKQAGVMPSLEVKSSSYVYIRSGSVEGRRGIFLIQSSAEPEPFRVRLSDAGFKGQVSDMISGKSAKIAKDGWIKIDSDPELGVAFLVEKK